MQSLIFTVKIKSPPVRVSLLDSDSSARTAPSHVRPKESHPQAE